MSNKDVVTQVSETDVRARVEAIAASKASPIRKAREILAIAHGLGRKLLRGRSAPEHRRPGEPELKTLSPDEVDCLRLMGYVRQAAAGALGQGEAPVAPERPGQPVGAKRG